MPRPRPRPGKPRRPPSARPRARSRAVPSGALDGVTVGLPALTRALKLQRRAARVGFDWPAKNALTEIEAKLAEEMGEIKAEIATGDKAAHRR